MCKFKRTLLPLALLSCFKFVYLQPSTAERDTLTEHPGGTVINDKIVFSKSQSPYWLRNDLIVEFGAELVIEPGVTVKIEPQVGITVRGILTAEGTENERITLTTKDDKISKNVLLPDIRLVDGPTILAGRVQVKHNGQWRSICTNSRNWTNFDTATACRQLGFQGGTFHSWYNRQMPLKPRILYEEPKCSGRENSIFDCQWDKRQMGSGVCDYHPDLGIECMARHDTPLPFWRGIRFENAASTKKLTLYNTLYVPTSSSKLKFVNIYYAGAGRDHNTTSALHVTGVPPIVDHLEIFNSAYNGINITNPDAPITINNCKIRNNRGYGIFINSSYGLAQIDGCTVTENGGDGIRFVRAEERPDERADRNGYSDFCKLALASSQTFPVQLFAEQTLFLTKELICNKVFTTRYGHVLTLNFIRAVTNRNDSSSIEILDGSTLNNRIIQSFSIRNNTRPQAITSTSNQLYIKFKADPMTETSIFMRITSGLRKSFDVNISNSDISENVGRGIAVDNLRSQVHIHKTSVSKNEHVAGIHVTSGVGDVNVTESRVSFNEGDGINVTYTGGSRNISRSSISSNKGYGIAIWLNNTAETEFIIVNQTTVVQYSEIYKNVDIGVLHGNYCGDALFNFTENSFKNCLNDALEVLSCWKPTKTPTKLQIGHNRFMGNEQISLKIYPAINLKAVVEYNQFRQGTFGGLLIKTKPLEEFNVLVNDIVVTQNYFLNNSGIFVVNLGLSPYSESQYLLFTRNFVKSNKISEPFQMEDGTASNLNPRSRVSAPVVVGSNNIDIFRNIIENPDSKYEIGSHLEDQSKTINCTYNWLGFGNDEHIFHRIFHRYDRYNLARISFIPFLLHNTNPLTSRVNANQFYVPKFLADGSDKLGGEIEGEEIITRGEYMVVRDISIRPGGKLTIEPGVTLRFPPSIGIMVGGRLEAKGIEPDSIKFTIKEELVHAPDNITYEVDTEAYDPDAEMIEIEPKVPIRLLGGNSETEGRLQLKINNEWGTVCNYGWTIENAALVCQQLGYVLNPDDWNMERNEIPQAGTTEKVILSNVQCTDFDLDILDCKSEKVVDFENSCSHENDVGIRCYKTSWAGIRFSSLADRTDLQFLSIEKAGLLDYATNSFKPALQLDFARQNFENIRVTNNDYHGLGIIYSDIFSESVNIIKNSEFSNNKGAGISLKQLGLNIYNSKIENNIMGIEHNSVLSGLQQREIAGWFIKNDDENYYNPFLIPQYSDTNIIELQLGETKYLVTSKIHGDPINRSYKIRCNPGWVLGVQLINPIENRSTENIIIHDGLTSSANTQYYVLRGDLTVFPTTSSSHGIVLDYSSGSNAFGGTVLIINTVKAPVQNIFKRIVKGPVPTLSVSRTTIRNNMFGVHSSYYNRYLDELGNHFLRKANETMKFYSCEITKNTYEAVFVHSPNWDLHKSNLSEITLMFNKSLIMDNGKGVFQFSRDMRSSNNLFHYVFQDNTIESNKAGGFDVALPYVWQYNENFTHSVFMDNNTWINNNNFEIVVDGHFAVVNITNNVFKENYCKTGLFALRGMEKKLKIVGNKFLNNNGEYVMEFSSNSQSEIIGNVPAVFMYNELRSNKRVMRGRSGVLQVNHEPTCVVGFRGIQKVRINRNLFADNFLEYQLLAGIKTAKINHYLDVKENWWGTRDDSDIKEKIFDFDDWNDHAIAEYKPYLLEDNFQASYSVSFSSNNSINLDALGGRLYEDLKLTNRGRPYVIKSDITVMPNVTLTIYPGVVLEFAPNVGILVLGILNARGYLGSEIIMRPLTGIGNLELRNDGAINARNKRQIESLYGQDSIRLCKSQSCAENDERLPNEGFLEYFNKTTLQWIPMCDSRFTERNAQVVCRELGFDPLTAFFDFGVRIDFHSNSLSRIWTWPEPLQCKGTEGQYESCPIRLNGQQFGHRHKCEWNSKFVFMHCERQTRKHNYWGGIRFTDAEFERQEYSYRIHDIHTHSTVQSYESTLEYVKIQGAGILHNEKSSAIQSVLRSPKINYVDVDGSAYNGIDLISPSKTMNLLYNNIQNSLGGGLNILSLSGEGRESDESSFTPLRDLRVPYNLFSLIDICDTHKEIRVQERVLVYYKYDNHPVNCIKIFKSFYDIKPLGMRLLQFDLFNSTVKYGIPDFLQMYDGDIYNVSSTVIDTITMTTGNEKKLFKSRLPSLSVKLFANGASSVHGFIAEVVTLPISAIGFNRDIQHNITRSIISNNAESGLSYMASGEVNPILTVEKNQFKNNCKKLYGNFTTCKSGLQIDVQNTQTIFFRSNLVEQNQGGLYIKSDSRGSATSLRGYIHNNLFVNNSNLPTLYIEGRKSSPYQEVTIYRNYFTRNYAQYHNNIVLKQVVSNFTYNYVKRNIGRQNLEVSGFDRVRLNIYQTTTHNGFYNNFAVERDSRSTVVAGTAGQHYVDNIFFDPDNDYEMITVNRSLFEFNSTFPLWDVRIDAANNYWGVNTSLAVRGRIKDQSDDPRLLEVIYAPYYMNNQSILDGKCPPGWELVGETCYMYVGAPMTFWEAKAFCQEDNASMPYLLGNINYLPLFDFLRRQNEWYLYSDKVWVQHIDRINECTIFAYQTVEIENCERRSPFICEIDPKVQIRILPLADDFITISVISSLVLAVILIIIVVACWWTKSKFRKAQRLERRNSIRQSLHSLRSIGMSQSSFADPGYRRKPNQMSTRSTDTLTKKMITNGSIDSMEKSAYSSSIDETQSYDVYESHNPNPTAFSFTPTIEYHKSPARYENQPTRPTFDLSFKNEGFRDNSTFASNSNYQSRADSVVQDESSEESPIMDKSDITSYPPSEYYNTDTLPLNNKSDSTLNLKRGIEESNKGYDYSLMQELKNKLPQKKPPTPPRKYSPTYSDQLGNMQFSPDYNTIGLAHPSETRSQSASLLETDFDEPVPPKPKPKTRARSEVLLETNFDYTPPGGSPQFNEPLSDASRSRSQPLETAM
ncbi:protein bark beetle isoform X1 [Diabrotica undecimpunctata]|uniref:protein bark beetle isoform X1 n=1 Tax=Diabrotica undecimpunctata TaxID=50387 RepID=UPI003B63E39D